MHYGLARRFGHYLRLAALIVVAKFPLPASADVDDDYKSLLAEQETALADLLRSSKFSNLRSEAQRFAPLVYRYLSEHHADRFSTDEMAMLQRSLDPLDLRRGPIDENTLVFHRFHGNWRGRWYQAGEWKEYDHTWEKPFPGLAMISQKVTIGRWDGEKRTDAMAAINAFDPITGVVLGGVDVDRTDPARGTVAPHLGVFIDEETLIWIARFGFDSDPAYYSIYFERIVLNPHLRYLIRGIGFHWDNDSEDPLLIDPHWKEGIYRPVYGPAREQIEPE